MAALLKGSLQTRRQRENSSGHSQSLVGFDSFVIWTPQACQSSAIALDAKRVCAGLEASCDVSSASIRIDLATPRVAHVNRGCCLQMVPRGSNAHYFSIQASPAPTSPPEFFLHSGMHNMAAAGGPPDWPTESPDTDGDAEPRASLIASIACIACCSVLIFVAWSPHIPCALPRQKSCCATRH